MFITVAKLVLSSISLQDATSCDNCNNFLNHHFKHVFCVLFENPQHMLREKILLHTLIWMPDHVIHDCYLRFGVIGTLC